MKSNYDTLILNKLYLPIHIVSWKRSVSLLYQDLAHSLDQDYIPYNFQNWIELCNLPTFDQTYYRYVHSVKYNIAVPDILVLSKYDKIPRRDIKFTRENVIQRDGKRCAYCGKKSKLELLTIDHILPKSRGGDNSWSNTITACKKCNNIKAARTPEEAGMKLLFQPILPKWTDNLSKATARPNIRPTWSTFMKSVGI